MAEEDVKGYSSLRQAVDRIMGFSPGGSAGQPGGETGQPKQASEFLMATKPPLSDISNVSNFANKTPTAPTVAPTAATPSSTIKTAPATGTDPNAALYSWTTPREREAAAAAAGQGIDYWGTTSPQSRAAAFASQDAYNTYKFKGQEWNDPIAQQIYREGNPNDRYYSQNVGLLKPGQTTSSMYSPLNWQGSQDQMYKNMAAQYTKQGGLAYGPISPYGK